MIYMHVCIAQTTHVCTPQAQVSRQSTSESKTPDNHNHNRATLSPIVDVKAKGGEQNGKDQRGRGISSLASTSSLVIWRKNGVCVSTLPKSNHPNPPQPTPIPLQTHTTTHYTIRSRPLWEAGENNMEQYRTVWNRHGALWSRHGRCDDGPRRKSRVSWARDERGLIFSVFFLLWGCCFGIVEVMSRLMPVLSISGGLRQEGKRPG